LLCLSIQSEKKQSSSFYDHWNGLITWLTLKHYQQDKELALPTLSAEPATHWNHHPSAKVFSIPTWGENTKRKERYLAGVHVGFIYIIYKIPGK